MIKFLIGGRLLGGRLFLSELEVFCECDPVFLDGVLWVNATGRDNEAVVATVTAMLQYLLRFRSANEARWTSVGTSCCFLLACWSL
eukprot:1032039-Amphidinium_carterae.1